MTRNTSKAKRKIRKAPVAAKKAPSPASKPKTVSGKNAKKSRTETKKKVRKSPKKTAPAAPKAKTKKIALQKAKAANKIVSVTTKNKAKKTAPVTTKTKAKKTIPQKAKTTLKRIKTVPAAVDAIPVREPGRKELLREEYLLSLPGPSESEIKTVDQENEPDPVKRDALKCYMAQISVYSRISVEDEVRLAKMIHGRNAAKRAQAEETLINANLRLVVKIAHDFKGMGLPLSDLISEGNIGLMRSVAKFDPSKGAKFSSYAAWWIKQSMHRALSNQTKVIRTPVQTGAKIHRVRRKREELQLQLGREPRISELAAALNFSERTVTMLLHADSSIFSLHDPIKTGENDTFEELIEDPNAKSPEVLCSNADSMAMLHQAFARLDPREQQVLTMRFYEGLTLEQASLLINRTRERVRQIQSQALRKLRSMLAEESEVVNS